MLGCCNVLIQHCCFVDCILKSPFVRFRSQISEPLGTKREIKGCNYNSAVGFGFGERQTHQFQACNSGYPILSPNPTLNTFGASPALAGLSVKS